MTTPPAGTFTEAERRYLTDALRERLARVATVGPDGTPHVVPVGWSYDPEREAIEIRGIRLEQTKKFRDAKHSGRASVVIDDLAAVDPWQPRGVEVRGRAEVLEGPPAAIRIHPERIVSWGIETSAIGVRHARSVAR